MLALSAQRHEDLFVVCGISPAAADERAGRTADLYFIPAGQYTAFRAQRNQMNMNLRHRASE